jgi:outer membrane protein OmpA-like peptidoglycan-associated protein
LSQAEWSGASLTRGGQEIVADVANSWAQVPLTRFDINGLADLASTPEGQFRINAARASAVIAELRRLEVPVADLTIVDVGDDTVPKATDASGDIASQHRIEIVIHR